MDQLRESYGSIEISESEDDETNVEKLVQKYLETNNLVDNSVTKDIQNSLIRQMKESFINTLDHETLMNYVLTNFDESGDFLGLDDEIHHVLQTKILHTDAIMKSVEQCVSQMITGTHDLSLVTLRRWNIHILAIIMQLLRMDMWDVDRERFKSIGSSVYDHLANYEYDWSFVTTTELKIMHNFVNLNPHVPFPSLLISNLI